MSSGSYHRPFETRFKTRLSLSSPLSSPRASSPAFLNLQSRQSSLSSQIPLGSESDAPEVEAPWEVMRWTKLKKITGHAFSEVGKRNFGRPTCLAVTTSILIGTSRGIILVFDYQQNNKAIIGPGTKALEAGAITALAISADHTTVAGGHADGSIFTWELARPAKPFLQIPPVELAQQHAGKVDGHVIGSPVLHLGFLGTRHTALVSGDDHGMAFSHLATRGMGALARVVKTVRILGRYPELNPEVGKARKPSSILALAPLPLGNVEQTTDTLGLTAILTPYLLVIVSTTPVAQTQHKAARPKEILGPGAMLSAALAWYPAIKLKTSRPEASRTKLVYCWSNVLTVLEVEEIEPSEPSEKPPSLSFRARSRWKAEEAIVAVQWLNRSVLAVLTITQRLIILEDYSMHVTDSFDLLYRHVYHNDFYSRQLHSLVEQVSEDDTPIHGVVTDAFHMSLRAHKGRLFLLGYNDVSIGNLSNWADRLVAMMETGDFIGAIRLATSYYNGTSEKLTIGLPEEADARHAKVQEKLAEMMSASLKFAFGRNQQASNEQVDDSQLEGLANACLVASISIDDQDFLFEEVYQWYEDHGSEAIFLDALEPYILEGTIRSLPPTALKALITHCAKAHSVTRLEEIICLLDTSTMDIDMVTTLCKQLNLYDAFIYVWNKAIGDYATPLLELISLIHDADETANGETDSEIEQDHENALKMFPYMSFTMTGRVYPTEELMPDEAAYQAKLSLFTLLFSGSSADPSARRGTKVNGKRDDAYAPLRKILKFDTPAFMSMLNEAFEDNFLNDAPDTISSPSNKQIGSKSNLSRQYVVSILLQVMDQANFDSEDSVYLDMFLARSLPKYPQYLLLSGTTLHQVLLRLCDHPSDDVADDCQLSVEYLLSIYHPPDIRSLIPRFKEAGFYNVLKATYKAERQYPELVETYFEDENDQAGVFECIRNYLQSGSGLSAKQIRDVKEVVTRHIRELAIIDTVQTAQTLGSVAPDLNQKVIEALGEEPRLQFRYLQTLLEPRDSKSDHVSGSKLSHSFVEMYINLMCTYDPSHVADYVDLLKVGDLHLEDVLPAMEESGVIDAAVVLLARQGQVKDGMTRLIRHFGTLHAALSGILENAAETPDSANTREAVEDILQSLEKYVKVGIWLCQGQAQITRRPSETKSKRLSTVDEPLTFAESLWLDLIDSLVSLARNTSSLASDETQFETETDSFQAQSVHISTTIRSIIQRVFTALLTSTTASRDKTSKQPDLSFLRILRAFLTKAAASSPSLSELRTVIASIFSAYAYEESLLSLANGMLDKDLFIRLDEVNKLRQQGWRPRGQNCEICKKRVWGAGAGAHVWAAWEKQRQNRQRNRRERQELERSVSLGRIPTGKGKAVLSPGDEEEQDERTTAAEKKENAEDALTIGGAVKNTLEIGTPISRSVSGNSVPTTSPIVVFSCRHMFHQQCLSGQQSEEALGPEDEDDSAAARSNRMSCPVCRRSRR